MADTRQSPHMWVVTGAGLVTAAGDTPAAVFGALCTGVPRARAVPSVPITDFDPKTYLERKGLKDFSRTSQLVCAAASRLADGISELGGAQVGVALGSAWGSLNTVIGFERAAFLDGPRFVDPLLFTETVSNVPAGQVAIVFGWSAFNVTLSSGTASGLEGICRAIDLLDEGRAELAVAGGCDELNLPILRALAAERVVASDPASLPFAKARSGAIGGEGACLLAVESEDRAQGRGASPLAHLLAAGGRYEPHGARGGDTRSDRIAGLIRELLERSNLDPADVDLVVLSGNGSVEADRDEARAIRQIFGHRENQPAAAAPKGILGETWGASGPIGIAVAIEAMRAGVVPGRPRGVSSEDDLEGLNMPEASVRRPVRRALVLDSAGRGHIYGVVLEAAEGARGA